MTDPLLDVQGLEAGYGPTRVLFGIDLQVAAGSITALLQLAVERGTPVAELSKLVDLHERMEARQAAKDFADAMARFQAECPSVKKSSSAKIVTNGGASSMGRRGHRTPSGAMPMRPNLPPRRNSASFGRL